MNVHAKRLCANRCADQSGRRFHEVQMKVMRQPFIALTNNKMEMLKLEEKGVTSVIQVDTLNTGSADIPEYPIDKVILFEESLTLTCRYIQICRRWTQGPIYVITQSVNPRLIYKGLGADYVIYSKNGDVKFLLSSLAASKHIDLV